MMMETILLKKVCKSCGSENIRLDVMREDGEDHKIFVCQEEGCRWWGS